MDPTPFLDQLAGRPFRWGETDCALALADYWLWATGRNWDPAEEYRGTYSDEAECQALLASRGGLLRVVAQAARDLGIPPQRGEPYPPGCVALVRLNNPAAPARCYGAIRAVGGRWAIKCNDGVLFTGRARRVIAAWCLP